MNNNKNTENGKLICTYNPSNSFQSLVENLFTNKMNMPSCKSSSNDVELNRQTVIIKLCAEQEDKFETISESHSVKNGAPKRPSVRRSKKVRLT